MAHEAPALARQLRPSPFCNSTKEELIQTGLNVVEDCPICRTCGVLCHVGSHPSRDNGAGLQSPKIPSSVFIFGSMENDIFMPAGTCFAVSERYLLTAQHNMYQRKLVGYGIALTVSKSYGVQKAPTDFHLVRVKYYSTQADWAILELISPPFTPRTVLIPISIEDVAQDTDFKVFHMPVSDYMFQDCDGISAFTQWMKTANPRPHHIEGNSGLFRGSSGAPFVLRNGRAFAMHVESRNDALIISEDEMDVAEVVSSTVCSNVQVYASRCSGLYFKKCATLILKLRELGVHIFEN